MDDLTIRARLLNGISGPAKEAKRDVEALAAAGAKAGRAASFDRATSSIGRLQSMSARTSGAISQLGGWLKDGANRAAELGQSIVSNIGSMATSAMHKAASAAKNLVKILAGGLTAGAAFGLKSFAAIESQQIAFTTLLGSADKANQLMREMKSFANVTPFRFGDVADSAKLLLAGGWKQDAIIPTLTKIGDAAAAVSVPIDRVLMQITQMNAGQAINWADMRVLSQTGLPVLEILGKKLGKTGAQIREIMSNPGGGKLLYEMGGLNALIDGLGEKYKGMMDAQSRSLSGLWSTVKDTFSNNLGDAMAPIAEGFIKPFLTKLIPQVERKLKSFAKLSAAAIEGFQGIKAGPLMGEGAREGVGKRKGGGIRGAAVALDGVLGGSKLTELFDNLAPKIAMVYGWLRKVATVSFAVLSTAIKGIGVAIKFVGDHKDIFKSVAIAIGLIVAAFAAWAIAAWAVSAAPVILIIIAVVALVALVVHLVRHWREVWAWIKKVAQAIYGLNPKLFHSIANAARSVAGAIRRAWNATRGFREAVGRIAPKALHAVASAAVKVAGAIRRAWNATRGFREAVGKISQTTIRGVARALVSVWGFAKKVWAEIKTFVGWIGKIVTGPVDALVGAFGAVVGIIGTAIKGVGSLIGAIGKIPKNIGGGGGVGGFIRNVGSALSPVGDTTAPRVRVRGYQTHGHAPLQRALSIGQGIKVTSGFRTHSLGSFNSAHKAGNGFDLVGSGLNSYAARLNNTGGFAQFHGNGSARHLHTEQPLGDSSAPRITPGRAQTQAPAEPVIINIHPMAHHSPTDIARMVRNEMDSRDRSRRERGSGR